MPNENMRENGEDGQFNISQKIALFDPATHSFLLIIKHLTDEQRAKLPYEAWDLPGGHLFPQEDPEQGLKREVAEEIGPEVKYELDDVADFLLQNSGFVIYLAEYQEGDINLSEEHEKYVWQTAEEIEKNEKNHPLLKQAIRSAAKRLKEKEYLNDLKRLQADFENYKKRQQESQKELAGYLIEKLVLDIVPVLDNFRAATMHVPEAEKDSPWVIGIQYIEKQLETVLTDNGVSMIDVKEGDAFDPKIHEALSDEGDGNGETHTVAKVVQKGYKFGNRVIRPAKVIVK